jgi:hypothetical protein
LKDWKVLTNSKLQLAVQAGRFAYLAGPMEKKYYASPSSPLEQISQWNCLLINFPIKFSDKIFARICRI